MTIQLTQQQWRDALYAADIDPDMGPDETEGPYVDLEYSGRAMYGGTCPAIIGAPEHGLAFLLRLALELHSCDEDEESTEQIAFELANLMRVDTLGTAHAIYFPGLEIVE